MILLYMRPHSFPFLAFKFEQIMTHVGFLAPQMLAFMLQRKFSIPIMKSNVLTSTMRSISRVGLVARAAIRR